SATAQGTAVLTYQATRPEPKPLLTIRLDGAGDGQVQVTRQGDPQPLMRCSKAMCAVELPEGTPITITAVLGDGSTFAGYHQYPMRTPRALVPWRGDPLKKCRAADAVEAAQAGDVRDCALVVHHDVEITADFGLQPQQLDVAIADSKQLDQLIKPLTPKP